MIDNLFIKDMVSSLGPKLYRVGIDMTLNQVVSYLIENNIPAAPVTKAGTKKDIIRQIEGFAILKDLVLHLKNNGENKIKDFMSDTVWQMSDNQYLVEKISVLHRKPAFVIKNSKEQYYATIFQKDVARYYYHITSRFMHIRSIESKISNFIYSIKKEDSIYDLPLGDKIKVLFDDDTWNRSKIEFDRSRLNDILNKCANLRNEFVHYRDSDIDLAFLEKSWKLIKTLLKHEGFIDFVQDNEEVYDEDRSGNHSQIVKHLLKSNKGMSKEEANKKAEEIWKNYCEQNKERDALRQKEHEERWDEALKWESYNTLFEYSDFD